MSRSQVLVLRALGLGDLLTALPALRGLREAYPEASITLALPANLHPLALLSGSVDACLDHFGPGPFTASLPDLDLAVNLHGRGPESHRTLLALSPKRLIAFSHPDVTATAEMSQWREREHEVRRWCRLLEEAGVPCDPGRLELQLPNELMVDLGGPTVIHPGAKSPARRWPAECWAVVAQREANRRKVLITAGPGEGALADEVRIRAGLPAETVKSAADILQLATTVGAAGRVASGDTGVAHLATALGIPSVVLFGPTSPDFWGPPPGRPCHRVLWSGQEGDPWAATVDPGLQSIRPEQVLEELDNL